MGLGTGDHASRAEVSGLLQESQDSTGLDMGPLRRDATYGIQIQNVCHDKDMSWRLVGKFTEIGPLVRVSCTLLVNKCRDKRDKGTTWLDLRFRFRVQALGLQPAKTTSFHRYLGQPLDQGQATKEDNQTPEILQKQRSPQLILLLLLLLPLLALERRKCMRHGQQARGPNTGA
jgi:hypothetical protein